MTDLWVEATHDFDREENDRQLIAAREAVVDLWQFLASAVNQDDFENRKALIADRLDQAAQGETRQLLEAALDQDFAVVVSQRRVVRPKGRTGAYDEFGDWKYEDAQAVITKLKAIDGYDEPAILAAIQGIGYDTFQVLDEKPGYFGNYYDEDWHWKLRRARNSAEGFFEALGPRNASKTAVTNDTKCTCGHTLGEHDEVKGGGPVYPPFQKERAQTGCTKCECGGFWEGALSPDFNRTSASKTAGAPTRKNADAAFEPGNPEFMAGFRAGSADARTQPTVNSPGTGMVPYGSSIPEGASDKFRKGYASGYQSATDVHMGSRKTAGQKLIRVDGQEYVIVKEVDDGIVVAEYSVLMPKTPQLLLMPADTEYEVIGESMVPIASRRTAEKYRADVAGVNESVWSNNAMEYDTPEEAKAWLADLSMRWFGYDMARVVPVSTPKHEAIDPEDPTIHQNFRSGSLRTAGGSGKYECQVCGFGFFNRNQFKIDCPRCGSIEVKDVGNPYGMANWGSRKTAFSPTHQCFDPSSPSGFVQCELVEGDPRGPEGTFVTVRREDGSTTSELGEMVIPLKEGSRKTAYYSIEWSGGFGTDSGYSSEAEAVRTAIENGDPEAGIFYNEASGDSYLGTAQALADELDLEEFNFQAHVQGSGSRGSARRHPFGRKTALAPYPTSTYQDRPLYANPSNAGAPRRKFMLVSDRGDFWLESISSDNRSTLEGQKAPGDRIVDTTTLEWSNTSYSDWELRHGSKTAASILDEDPENNTMTTEQGVWTMEYDSESMKRMKSADDYEPWFPEFPGEQHFTQPHHYKLTGPKGQVHEFSAQGDSVVSPWYAAWEQARNIVQQSSRKTATTFLVKHDFSQSQPAVNWAKSDYGRRYGPNNEGFTVEADSEEEVKQILRSQHNLNPTFVTITRQEIPGQEKLTASKTAQAGPPEPWPESACGEQDEDTFCIRDTDHEGDHQFRSRFWIENKMDEAGLTSIEEELPEEGEEQAEEVPPENGEAPPEKPAESGGEEKKKGEVPPQFKKKTSRPKADLSRVAEEEPRICQDCGYPLNEATPNADCMKHPAPRAGMRKVTAFVLGEPEDWEDRVHYRMVARGIGRNTPHSQRTTHLLERAKQWATREGAEGWKAANDFVYGSYEILEVGVDAEPFLNANREYLKPRAGMLKGAPFADYKDFADCTSKNSDKDDPEAYCGYIKHKVEDTKESILIASALLPRLTNADFEQATAELSGEKQWV